MQQNTNWKNKLFYAFYFHLLIFCSNRYFLCMFRLYFYPFAYGFFFRYARYWSYPDLNTCKWIILHTKHLYAKSDSWLKILHLICIDWILKWYISKLLQINPHRAFIMEDCDNNPFNLIQKRWTKGSQKKSNNKWEKSWKEKHLLVSLVFYIKKFHCNCVSKCKKAKKKVIT